MLTPVQRRTVERLMTAPATTFAHDLAARLRDEILGAVGTLAVATELWLGKERLNDRDRCEGLLVSQLLKEGPPFEHGFRSASGKLAHRAVQSDVGRGRRDPSRFLVERAASRLAEEDDAFARYWRRLDPVDRSELVDEGVRLLEQFRATFPPLGYDAGAVTELPLKIEVGPLRVLGYVDLVLGRPDPRDPMRATRLAIDLKGGMARPEFPEDMRLYALLLALRTGVPPYRVATVFLDSGEWQLEDVTEETLFHAARRLSAGARTAARLLAGGDPVLRPGRHCSWCPRSRSCPETALAAEPAELPGAAR